MQKSTPLNKNKLRLLEKLSNALSVSGDEAEVRTIILEEIRPYIQDYKVDSLGNLLVIKNRNSGSNFKVMLSAHMDEVGFMIASDEGEGILRFELNGGIDLRQLPGKAVIVGKDHIPGVIGARPIHLTTASERQKKIPLNNLRIDVGPGKHSVKPGDRATFATQFQKFGGSFVGKALDDRLGVAILIDLVKNAQVDFELQAAFTVQEETGLRGARVAAFSLKPDVAFVIDSTLANDLPAWDDQENFTYNSILDAGPAIYIADAYTLSDPRLINFLKHTAEKEGIPYQFRQPGNSGSEAGAIHKQNSGIPAITVSVPTRYVHTSTNLARIQDYSFTSSLMNAALHSITSDLLDLECK